MNSKIKIYMADLVHNYIQGNYVVPLNVASVAAYLKANLKTDIKLKLFKYPVDLIDACSQEKPDILALSNYFWNTDLNRQIGMYVRKNYPDVVISMGGPSIRIVPAGMKEFLENNFFVDVYNLFEGEKPFTNLVKRVMADRKHFKDGDCIEGCAYLADGKLVYEPSDPIRDLSACPSPYLTGLMDEFLSRGFIPLFESSRGCPFSCTFCTWGISALRRVRAFPSERIFAELELVGKNFSNNSIWIFADANFGIFNRDLQIAEKIREIKKKTPQLRKVMIWQTKNASKQNLEIAKMIGELDNYLIAVQTFDPVVLELVKRKNIRCEDALAIADELKLFGVSRSTDILCGLPGETKKSHLDTLRKCFDIGFDFICTNNVLMLPGSEMETEESRRKFKLITKYRLRQGSYGEYKGIKSLEYEELVRGSATMSESDMLELRLIHWMIWYGWNSGFLKSIMKYLHCEYRINPVDLIIHIVNSKDAFLSDFFHKFSSEAKNEWFKSEETLREYYKKEENWNHLLHNHFSKMTFKYTALLILKRGILEKFLSSISKVVVKLTSSEILHDVFGIIKEKIISPDEIYSGNVIVQKSFKVRKECLIALSEDDNFKEKNSCLPNYCDIMLEVNPEDMVSIRSLLEKHDFKRNKNIALEKTLEMFHNKFNYTIKVTTKQ